MPDSRYMLSVVSHINYFLYAVYIMLRLCVTAQVIPVTIYEVAHQLPLFIGMFTLL
jgi:hypothetical protein